MNAFKNLSECVNNGCQHTWGWPWAKGQVHKSIQIHFLLPLEQVTTDMVFKNKTTWDLTALEAESLKWVSLGCGKVSVGPHSFYKRISFLSQLPDTAHSPWFIHHLHSQVPWNLLIQLPSNPIPSTLLISWAQLDNLGNATYFQEGGLIRTLTL